MNSTSHPVSKDLERKTETCNSGDEEVRRPGDTIACSAADECESPMAVSEDVAGTFLAAFVFTKDILPEILDNVGILNSRDLLNFRLVNRSWRDAATLVLLKRNMCQINLGFGEVVSGKGTSSAVAQTKLNTSKNKPTSYKYFNVYHPRNFLSDLSTLISTSSKFPASSVRFHEGLSFSSLAIGFPLLSGYDINTANQNQNDLFHFSSLYGKNIKKLSLCSGISKKAVQNMMYVHMPHISCLDLQDFHEFSIQGQTQKEYEMKAFRPSPSILEITEIILGHEPELSVDKFNSIKELISVSPNLSKITNVRVSALKLLLDTEKCHLIKDLHFNPTLRQLATVRQFAERLNEMNLNEDLPCLKLKKLVVQLDMDWEYRGNWDSIRDCLNYLNTIVCASKDSLTYFKLSLHGKIEKAVLANIGNTRLTVNTIQLNEVPLDGKRWFNFFPNVTHLKVMCKYSYSLENRNWIWTAFPKLKKFEIFGFTFIGDTSLMDMFFTGISHELCAKLQKDSATLPQLRSGPAHVIERIQPYIGDCKNLQEFKINFANTIHWKFASNVTAAYGFEEIFHQTKIVFSFKSIKWSAEGIEDTHKHLDPVAAYVDIQVKK